MTTLAQALEKLAEYQAAESRILQAQQVRIGGTGATVDRWEMQTDLEQVRQGIDQWQRRVNQLQAASAGLPTLGGFTFRRANFS